MLQLAMAYAAIANGGTLYVPQVVDRVEASNGRSINVFQPTVVREVKVSTDDLDVWKQGMWKVTNQLGGTAYEHGHTEVVPVYGKTGTAEIRGRRHRKDKDERDIENWNPRRSHAWFAGWAMNANDEPDLVIVVLVEHGGSGGRVAWPIARHIFEHYYGPNGPGASRSRPVDRKMIEAHR